MAEGKFDIYPRNLPTMEWDTAAGQAILEGAGGEVKQLNGENIQYGKLNILNPYFIAKGITNNSVFNHNGSEYYYYAINGSSSGSSSSVSGGINSNPTISALSNFTGILPDSILLNNISQQLVLLSHLLLI